MAPVNNNGNVDQVRSRKRPYDGLSRQKESKKSNTKAGGVVFGARTKNKETVWHNPRNAVDLFVPICKASSCSSFTPEQTMNSVLHRLGNAGYIQCALTHTVYGRPKEDVDLAEAAIPAALFKKSSIPVLRRLHVVVENLSDVALFSGNQSPIENVLKGYDIISLNPRNVATLEASCRIFGRFVDIVSIDYYSSYQLPFRLRRADVQQLVQNGIILEIPYAPALIDTKARRNLMMTCNEVVSSCSKVLLSSGPRIVNNEDAGPQALRLPGDLLNFAHVVMGLSAKTVRKALDGSFLAEKQKARNALSACRPQVTVTNIEIGHNNETFSVDKPETVHGDSASLTRTMDSRENAADDDGFIAL